MKSPAHGTIMLHMCSTAMYHLQNMLRGTLFNVCIMHVSENFISRTLQALRQRAGAQPLQPAAAAAGAPAQSQELSELQAAIAAAHAERDDALAAAEAAHADAERAQLREQMKVSNVAFASLLSHSAQPRNVECPAGRLKQMVTTGGFSLRRPDLMCLDSHGIQCCDTCRRWSCQM